LRGDREHLAEIESFLLRERVMLDIFVLRRQPRKNGVNAPRQTPAPSSGEREAWHVPLDAPVESVSFQPGDRVTLDIIVTNRGVGHNFPTGYTDIREAWLEVTLHDATGRTLLANGLVGDNAPLPPDSHVYRMLPLDKNGDALQHHDLDRMTTTAYRRTIAPGDADIARYAFTLSREMLSGSLQIRARLRYRPLRPDFARRVLGETETRLPITTLADATQKISLSSSQQVANNKTPLSPTRGERGRALGGTSQRFIIYGNGLLAPKTRPERAAALRAFRIAQTLVPDSPEAYLGMGRAHLTEPDYLAARAQFEKALSLAPQNDAARHLLGIVFRQQGEYQRALELLVPLAKRFPEDAALHFDLGLTYYRDGRYDAAATAFRNALAADPDSAPAHYQLKQAYQRLRRVPDARREEASAKYLAEDEQAARLRELYLQRHPRKRPLALPIPTHSLHPPTNRSLAHGFTEPSPQNSR
jgi:tetratricopeptide (TPR) repeat protein